mgnify:CR=1 FL=1
MDELVSVNICTYNRSKLLSRCLESVIAQDYPNFEVVIVDDCSTDDTEQVVEKFKGTFKRIKYIKHAKNKKLAVARNTGVENSLGHYIAFMDDDDEWLDKSKLTKQVETFSADKSSSLGLVATSVILVDVEGNQRKKRIEKPKNLKQILLRGNGILYSPTVMTKKSILEEIGGFDENLRRGIDSEFYRLCVLKYGYDVIFLEDFTTAIHEYGTDRITSTDTLDSLKSVLKANAYLLKKYSVVYVRNPMSMLVRVKVMLMALRKYLIIRFSINNLR